MLRVKAGRGSLGNYENQTTCVWENFKSYIHVKGNMHTKKEKKKKQNMP